MDNNRKMLIANQLSFGILGAIEAAWAPMVPFVKSGMQLDDAQFGRLLLAMGLGSLIALPFVGPLVNRYGCRFMAILGCIIEGLSLVGITFSDNMFVVIAMLMLFGTSLIIVDVSSNVNAVIVESIFKRPLMSGFHGGYSLGTIVGALLMTILLQICSKLGLAIDVNLSVSAVILFVIMTALTLVGCKSLVSDIKSFNAEKFKKAEDTEEKKQRKLNLPLPVLIIGCLCFIMYSSEGALLSWSTVFATQNIGIDPVIAGYFYLFFAVTMTTSRYLGNGLVRRVGRLRTVVTGAVLVSLGFIITALIPHYVGMMIGFTFVGLGAGNIVPQLVSFAGTVKGIRVQSAISLVNSLGYSGILLGPVIIGQISKSFSLETSFVCIGCAVCVVAIVSFFLLQPKRANA